MSRTVPGGIVSHGSGRSLRGRTISVRRHAASEPVAHLDGQGVVCDVRIRSYDRNRRTVACELAVSNAGAVPVRCRLYGLDSDADTLELGMLAVPAHDAAHSLFLIPLAIATRGNVHIEVIGDGVSLSAETVLVSERPSRSWPPAAIGALVLMGAVAAGAVYRGQMPSVDVLGLPATTTAGSVRAEYFIGGNARGRYRVTLANGSVVAAGDLKSSGVLEIPVPAGAAGQPLTISIAASGPFGQAEAVRRVAVRPHSRIVADDPLRGAAVVVERGSGAPSDQTGARAAFAHSDEIAVHGAVRAGTPFVVDVKASSAPRVLQLRDGLNAVVQQVDVGPQSTKATLTAPSSPITETYYLVATTMRGHEENSVVESVRVQPT